MSIAEKPICIALSCKRKQYKATKFCKVHLKEFDSGNTINSKQGKFTKPTK